MGKDVSLADIEAVIDCCTQQKTIDFSSFPWLREKLSLFSLIFGFFGGTKNSSWQKKYLIPVLAAFSRPYLYRFYEGDWRAYEEGRLKELFGFFSAHSDACEEEFPSELRVFLKGQAPSFLRERERLQIQSREGVWGRNETFAEYKKRLQGLSREAPREKVGLVRRAPHEVEVEAIHPLSGRTKERLDALLEKLHAFREECLEGGFQLEKERDKVFPLRYEAEALFHDIAQYDEGLADLIQDSENEITRLSEMNIAPHEEQAISLVEESSLFLRKATDSLQSIKNGLRDVRPRIEEIRSLVNKHLAAIIRSIDHVLSLPATSAFRPRQARIVRMARDKVKKFKEALYSGPGPSFLLTTLEKEVHLLVKLAEDFYAEGRDVEDMREKLSHLSAYLKKIIDQESDVEKHVLATLLEEIQDLQQTLEVAPDRKDRLHKICDALALREGFLHSRIEGFDKMCLFSKWETDL